MKAYRKETTRDPLCVYFTDAEGADVADECLYAVRMADESGVPLPTLGKLLAKLNALITDHERKRA